MNRVCKFFNYFHAFELNRLAKTFDEEVEIIKILIFSDKSKVLKESFVNFIQMPNDLFLRNV
jgi:hypothetical protein